MTPTPRREALESRFIDLDGPVHFADFGGEGPTMVLVHGLGGSAVNWMAVGPGLATRARVLAPDLAGFGRSPLAGRSARVQANQRLLGRFIDEFAVDPVILVGNSMGGMIALRVGPEGMVSDVLQVCCAEPEQIPAELVDVLRASARERVGFAWADTAFLQAARSLITTLVMRPRRYLRLIAEVDVPTLLIQGAADRLVPLASIEALVRNRPEWTVHVLDGIGHVPQLEAPRRFVELVTAWLGDQTAEPGRRAV